MDVSTTRSLIKKMLDSRDLMPETREELAEYLADLDKDGLHPDDVSYVYGLARRLGYSEAGVPADPYAAEAMGDSLGEDFADTDEGESDTAAAVQAEIALRAVEQARALVTRMREAGPDGAGADAATLDELDHALGEAAAALTPRD
ncbi:MAG: hypothetical protein P8126_02130 [Gammaproteobacteria bacterium]